MSPIAFIPHLLRVDIIDVYHGTKANPGGVGVQFRLAACGFDGLRAGLGAQLGLGRNVEIDCVDLVGAGGNEIDEKGLHIIKVGGLDRKRRLALIAKESPVFAVAIPCAFQIEPGPVDRRVGYIMIAQGLADRALHRWLPQTRPTGIARRVPPDTGSAPSLASL